MNGSSKPSSAVEGALHAARGEAQRLADARQAVQRGALSGDVGHFAQLAERHGDAVVLADHREAGGAAVHLLGLLDQREARMMRSPMARPRLQVEQQGRACGARPASSGAPARARRTRCARPAPRAALGLRSRMSRPSSRGSPAAPRRSPPRRLAGCSWRMQAGLLAEDLALAQRRQRVLLPSSLRSIAHLALAHHVETAVLAAVLLEDLSGRRARA